MGNVLRTDIYNDRAVFPHIYFPTLSPIVLPAPPSRNMPAAATTTTQRIPRHDEYYIHGGDVVFCVRMSIIGRPVLTQSRESTGG
jgi:hypothetical protein